MIAAGNNLSKSRVVFCVLQIAFIACHASGTQLASEGNDVSMAGRARSPSRPFRRQHPNAVQVMPPFVDPSAASASSPVVAEPLIDAGILSQWGVESPWK